MERLELFLIELAFLKCSVSLSLDTIVPTLFSQLVEGTLSDFFPQGDVRTSLFTQGEH